MHRTKTPPHDSHTHADTRVESELVVWCNIGRTTPPNHPISFPTAPSMNNTSVFDFASFDSTSMMLLAAMTSVLFLAVHLFRPRTKVVPSTPWPSDVARPVSVNFHFTRTCNYACDFCFHTAKTSHREEIESMKAALTLLRDAGMKKVNFSGGEPFLYPKLLGELCEFCAVTLGVAVTIVSNGSKITEEWLMLYKRHVDYIAISCDTMSEDTSVELGRHDGSGKYDHVSKVRKAAALVKAAGVGLRINTTVTALNRDEDMREFIRGLAPKRWKVFQMLLVEGENFGLSRANNRDATRLVITAAQFAEYVERHREIECMVPENNATMQNSYVILDEYLRLLDTSSGAKKPSESILDVGVEKALRQSNGFDTVAFKNRKGIYDWQRVGEPAGSMCSKELDW
jgi:radical S-adenosyl methionine domain-containing protein 2